VGWFRTPALGILAQLEFAEAHVQRIDQQQAADEGIAFAEDELDHFSGLNDAYETGRIPSTPPSAQLGTGGRRRLG